MDATEPCRLLHALALAIGRVVVTGIHQGTIDSATERPAREAIRDVLAAWLGRPATEAEISRVLNPPQEPRPEETGDW